MGNYASDSSATPISKTQFMSILEHARILAIPTLLAMKKEYIEARRVFYKVDPVKYHDLVFEFIQSQPKLSQGIVLQLCSEQNVTPQSFAASMQMYMVDPEVHALIVSFQTLSNDICEGQPVPDEYDIEKLKEGLRVQTRALSGYPIRDGPTSVIAQVAACDEMYCVLGIDEITFGALAIKYEESTDSELHALIEEWKKASTYT